MNKVVLVGRLTHDPELRTTQSGKAVATFSVAVDRKYKQDGQPTADFFNCVAWGKTGEIICQYLSKGRQISLCGHLQTRSYQTKDGSKRSITEVIVDEFDFIGSKSDNARANNNGNQNYEIDLGDDFHLMVDDDDAPF